MAAPTSAHSQLTQVSVEYADERYPIASHTHTFLARLGFKTVAVCDTLKLPEIKPAVMEDNGD